MKMDIYRIAPEEMKSHALMPLRVMETEPVNVLKKCRDYCRLFEKNKGEQNCSNLPVGPIGHYPLLA